MGIFINKALYRAWIFDNTLYKFWEYPLLELSGLLSAARKKRNSPAVFFAVIHLATPMLDELNFAAEPLEWPKVGNGDVQH